MKKIFALVFLCFLLTGCYTTTVYDKTPEEFESIARSSGYNYTSRAASRSSLKANTNVFALQDVAQGAHVTQRQANQIAMDYCHRSGIRDCIIIMETGKITYEAKNYIASLKPKQPKKQKPKIVAGDNTKIVPAASGSGFYINSAGYAVTNDHVIQGCRKVSINAEGQDYDATIIATDPKNDLAIIKSKFMPKSFYKISSSDVKLLDDVIIAGYPLGKRVSSAIKTSKGSVTAMAGYGDNFSNFQTDAALNQGNSGGPIINRTGSVVGVAVANFGKKDGVESFNFGIKSSTLTTFITSNDIRITPGTKSALSNQALGNLVTKGTIYIECWLTVADIKRIMAEEENRKAIYSEYQ